MRLGFDLDGVTVDFHTGFTQWVVDTFGVAPLEVTRWNWFEDYRIEDLWPRFWQEGGEYLRGCRAMPGAEFVIKSLYHAGFDVCFITYRREESMPDTMAWLERHGLDFPLYHAEDKSSVPCALYVDDHGPTVQHLIREGRNAFVYDRAWNTEYEFLPRVGGWADIAGRAVDLVVGAETAVAHAG